MWNLNIISNEWAESIGLAKKRAVTLAGLDIGTSKTAVVIAQIRNGLPQILGSAEIPGIGVSKGCITSPEAAAKVILQVLEQAQGHVVNDSPSTVYVSFNGDTVAVRNCLVELKTGGYSDGHSGTGGFSHNQAGLLEEESTLHFINPRELPVRSVFEVEAGARVVAAPTRNIRDIYRAVHLSGLKVEDVVFGPLAAAEVLLTRAEKELGTILIDIGAGTTSVSIFDLGELRETAVLPVGGEHLASDLAIGLHISLAQAAGVLKDCELSEAEDDSLELAKSIIQARLSEILYLTGSVIKSFQYPGLLPGGAVFGGGVTLLGGFAPFAENILQVPVRLGSIQVDGYPLSLTKANAFGLVKYGAQRLTNPGLKLAANCEPVTLMDRLLKWLQGRIKNGSRL